MVGAESPEARVGWLLACAAAIEMLHGLRRRRSMRAGRPQAAADQPLIAFPLIGKLLVTLPALRLLVALFFAIDVVRYGIQSIQATKSRSTELAAAAALGNTAVLHFVVLPRAWMSAWVMAVAGAARMAGTAWNITTARIYDTSDADQTIAEELVSMTRPKRWRSRQRSKRQKRTRAHRSQLDARVDRDALRDSREVE